MFTAGMMESREHRVNINEVEAEEFGLLLDFAYTSTVEISTANVQVFIIFIKHSVIINMSGHGQMCLSGTF